MTETERPPLPPFTLETAAQKARAAEDAWNSRDPERVSLAYTVDSVWRNRSEFFEVCWAAQRSGLYYTAVNWHFNADETAYILDDCDAQVLVISEQFRGVATELLDKMPGVKLRLMVGGIVDGYDSYEETRDRYPAADGSRPTGAAVRGTATARLTGLGGWRSTAVWAPTGD